MGTKQWIRKDDYTAFSVGDEVIAIQEIKWNVFRMRMSVLSTGSAHKVEAGTRGRIEKIKPRLEKMKKSANMYVRWISAPLGAKRMTEGKMPTKEDGQFNTKIHEVVKAEPDQLALVRRQEAAEGLDLEFEDSDSE